MTVPDEGEVVTYEVRDSVAVVTLNRPDYRNAQNSVVTYALDAAFERAVQDDEAKVIVLAGNGKHFCAGHDIGTPGRDHHVHYDNKAVMWWDHVDKPGGDQRYAREMEVYLGMCRRWREIPKPMIAMVQGACIAGGLMLAWVCDLIVASEDAFFLIPWSAWAFPASSTSPTRGCSVPASPRRSSTPETASRPVVRTRWGWSTRWSRVRT